MNQTLQTILDTLQRQQKDIAELQVRQTMLIQQHVIDASSRAVSVRPSLNAFVKSIFCHFPLQNQYRHETRVTAQNTVQSGLEELEGNLCQK